MNFTVQWTVRGLSLETQSKEEIYSLILRPAVFMFRHILEVCLVYIRPSFHLKVSLSLSRRRQRARYHIISREQSAAVGCFRMFYSYVKMV